MKRLALLVALTGCDGGGADLSAGDAIARRTALTCEQGHVCRETYPEEGGFEFEDFFQTSVDECVAFFTGFVDPERVQDSVDEGRILYDSSEASACLDALETVDCARFWEIFQGIARPSECDRAFIGTVADGGTCSTDLDCLGPDSTCDSQTSTCGI
jgi:hypothetical protein